MSLTGDQNGDGRQDLLSPRVVSYQPAPGVTGYRVQVLIERQQRDGSYQELSSAVDLPSDVPRHLPQTGWLVADLNGDHRADLVNLPPDARYGLVLLASQDYSWEAHEFSLAALDATAHINLGATGGGTGGTGGDGGDCDLLAHKQACPRPRTAPGASRSVGVPVQAMLPAGRWLVAPEGDGERDALVHVGQLPFFDAQLGKQLSYEDFPAEYGVLALSLGGDDAVHVEWSQPPGVPVAAIADGDRWTAANVTGDPQGDLVHVDTETGDIETLLRDAGGWERVSQSVSVAPAAILDPGSRTNGFLVTTGGNGPQWSAVDVNGDGAVDLARVLSTAPGQVVIETLLSEGAGRWAPITSAPMAGLDVAQWTPGNVDLDNRGDLVSVYNRGSDLVVQTALSNGDGTWTLNNSPFDFPPVSSLPAVADWQIGDVDGNGWIDLLRFDDDGTLKTISGLESEAPHEAIAGIDNGLGAHTSINYIPGIEMVPADGVTQADCRTPSGVSAAPVAASLTTSETATNTTDTSTFSYSCLRYSPLLRAPLAWATTETTHAAAVNRPASIEHVERQVRDSGIVQTTLEQIRDAAGIPLVQTASSYGPATPGADIDQLTETQVSTCRQGQCPDPGRGTPTTATSTTTLAYDDFGNVKTSIEQAAGTGYRRRTDTTYIYDHAYWLEGLPRETTITDPDTGAKLRGTLTCYDGDPSQDCGQLPEKPRGLPTQTSGWYDNQKRYVPISRATYDRYGNQLTSTDANRHTTTTTWDPAEHLHPISTCNAKNQCVMQPEPWDRRADAPTLITDVNGGQTHISYDPLGRTTETIGPGGAKTTRSYAADALTEIDNTTGRDGTTGPWTRTYADGLGRTYRIEHYGGLHTREVAIDTQYSDGSDRPFKVSQPYYGDAAAKIWGVIRDFRG